MSNTDTQQPFQWDEQKAKDLCEYVGLRVGKGADIKQQVELLTKNFKASRSGSVPEDIDWEVVSFVTIIGQVILADATQIGIHDHRLSHPSIYNIKCVRRLSDNTEWTVGETVGTKHQSNVKIKLFNIVKEKMMVECEDDYCDLYWLTKLPAPIQEKPVLFTTEDGVKKYEGDSCVYVDATTFRKSIMFSLYGDVSKTLNYKFFGSEQAANEYILLNNPCLSVSDVIQSTGTTQVQSLPSVVRYSVPYDSLIELVQSKLNKE